MVRHVFTGLAFGLWAISSFAAGSPSSPPFATASVAASPQPDAHPPSSNEVTLWVALGHVHTDLVIPRAAFAGAPPPLRAAVAKAPPSAWISVGWGPYWFGRHGSGGWIHKLSELQYGWTLVVPQGWTRLRIAALQAPGPAPEEPLVSLIPLQVSQEQLARALDRINASLEVGQDGKPILGDQYGVAPGVTLYRSKEIYHTLHNCNQWAVEVLHAAGVPTSMPLALTPGMTGLQQNLVYGAEENRPER
jgi:hypothetical protein